MVSINLSVVGQAQPVQVISQVWNEASWPNSTFSQGDSQEGTGEGETAEIRRDLLSSYVFNPQGFSIR